MNLAISKALLLYEKQNKKCAYCERTLDGTFDCNIDHIIPKSRGGTNALENLCLTCISCNNAKANMTGEEFKVVMEMIKAGTVKKEDLGKYAQYLVLKNKFEPKEKIKMPAKVLGVDYEYNDDLIRVPLLVPETVVAPTLSIAPKVEVTPTIDTPATNDSPNTL